MHYGTVLLTINMSEKLKVDGTSFSDAGSLVMSATSRARFVREIQNTEKAKQIWGHKNYYLPGVFFLSVQDWIKTKVVLWASVVKQYSMR